MPVVGLSVCGRNDRGQLGDGTTTNRLTVVPMQLPAYPVDVAASVWHTLVALEDGTVWAWGWNAYGQLGDGTTEQRLSPVQVLGPGGQGFLSGIVSVAAAGGFDAGATNYQGSHSLALSSQGEVFAWGCNAYGQLGDGSTTNRSTPTKVPGIGSIVAIAAGGGAKYNYPAPGTSYALTADGTVYAWGYDNEGQCGQGTTTLSRPNPVQVQGLDHVVAIAAGGASARYAYDGYTPRGGHALALKDNGEVWAWGNNLNGQLGDGTTTNRALPVRVAGLSDVVAIACGGAIADTPLAGHSLALRADGTVWAWGLNNCGQLGDGTTTNRLTPVKVQGLTDVVAIAAGARHSLARRKDGTVWAWGYNAYGQLGDGTTTDRLTPTQVSGIDGSDLVWKCARTLGDHTVLMHPHPGRLYLGQIDGIRFEQLIGRVLAGDTLGPIPIPVFNFCPQSVSGVRATRLSLAPNDVIEISATRDPFVAEDPVYLSGTFGPGEQIGTVWVRVKPPILVDGQPNQGRKQFTLKATNAQ